MERNEMIGKIIKDIKLYKITEYDDEPYMQILFTDGSEQWIRAGYGCFSGKSKDEYPAYIYFVDKPKEELTEVAEHDL